MLQHYIPRRLSESLPSDVSTISPLYAPHGDMLNIYGSCSIGAFEIISDMYALSQTFLARCSYGGNIHPAPNAAVAAYDAQLQQIYSRLRLRPSTEADLTPDWVYESCRLAALIYCRSIVRGVSLAESANLMHPRGSGPEADSTTLLLALHEALMRTDTRGCWGSTMRGVFLWVCLVGGAASWPSARFSAGIDGEDTSPSSTWARKCFALYAVRASVSVPFEYADSMIQALRTMLQVRHWIGMNIGLKVMSR